MSETEILHLAGVILANVLPAKMRTSMPGKTMSDAELDDLARLSFRAVDALIRVDQSEEDKEHERKGVEGGSD